MNDDTIEVYRDHCRKLAEQAERDAARGHTAADRGYWHGYRDAMRAVVADMPDMPEGRKA